MDFSLDFEKYWGILIDNIIFYGPKVLVAVVVSWVGFKLINRLVKLAVKALAKIGLNSSLVTFLKSILGLSLKGILLIFLAGYLGVDLTIFVTVLATAGLAVGLALQGSLSNFAAGIIILIFRPYRVDDWIEVDGGFGKVEEIQIFSTQIVTPGKKTLIIPNGAIVEGIVTNYSKKGSIRLELSVTMPYEESYPKVQAVLKSVLEEIVLVKKDPAPEIGIESYDSHSVVIAVRPYVDPNDYWEVTFEAYEKIKKAFSDHQIRVAYSEGVEIGVIGD